MKSRLQRFSFAILATVWLSLGTVFGQPNLADLLDREERVNSPAASPAVSPGRAQSGPQKAPVPLAIETKRAIVAIQDIFRAEFAAANSPDKRVALAQQLLTQAERTTATIDRWALLVEAARLAVEAGDPTTTFEVIDATMAVYAIDPMTAKLEAIGKLIPKVSPQTADELTLLCLDMCRRLVGSEHLPEARKLLTMTSALTKKSGNRALIGEVTKLTAAIREAERSAKERQAILEKLAASPTDPETCLKAGLYFCFKSGDWERGLPLLAEGSDADLARLAKDDLAARGALDRAAAIGDAWWSWAEGQKGSAKAAGLLRAGWAYEKAVAIAQGLEKVRLEKRIKEAQAEQPSSGRRIAVADLQDVLGKNIFCGLTRDGTFSGKPFTCQGNTWPKALVAHISDVAKQHSSIVFPVPNGAKKLVGTAGIFSAAGAVKAQQPAAPQIFEILLDGRTAWKSTGLTRRDDLAKFEVELHGVREVELRVSTTTFSGAWTAWLNPEIVF